MQREGVVHKMEMRDLALPSLNRFASDYLQGHLEVEDYFHYDLASSKMYHNRYQELMNRTFMRQELADYIEDYMARFPKSDAVVKNISGFKKGRLGGCHWRAASRFTNRAFIYNS